MTTGYYPFTTRGQEIWEDEVLPGVTWYDEEYKEWVIEIGGFTGSYQYTQERPPLRDMESRTPVESYAEAWEQAVAKVDKAYSKILG